LSFLWLESWVAAGKLGLSRLRRPGAVLLRQLVDTWFAVSLRESGGDTFTTSSEPAARANAFFCLIHSFLRHVHFQSELALVELFALFVVVIGDVVHKNVAKLFRGQIPRKSQRTYFITTSYVNLAWLLAHRGIEHNGAAVKTPEICRMENSVQSWDGDKAT
jgi:hypothetical protein